MATAAIIRGIPTRKFILMLRNTDTEAPQPPAGTPIKNYYAEQAQYWERQGRIEALRGFHHLAQVYHKFANEFRIAAK